MSRRLPELRIIRDRPSSRPSVRIRSQSGRQVDIKLDIMPKIIHSQDSGWSELSTYGEVRPLNWTHTSPRKLTLENCIVDGDYCQTTLQYLRSLELLVRKDRRRDANPPLFRVSIGDVTYRDLACTGYEVAESLHIPGTGRPSRLVFTLDFIQSV